MKIAFKTLALENFKNHKKLNIKFGDITNVRGKNGAGKSSIGDAITWELYGTDIMGNKLDPKPIGSEGELETKVELLLQVDDKDILLSRTQKKTAKYFVNEVPKKATEFNELVGALFDKKLFLSSFNPSYFFTQHWQDQRSQLLQYVKEPLNKEILAKMSKVDRERLEVHLLKYSLDDLEKLHKERAKQRGKEYERAAERVLTLEEQISKIDTTLFDEEEIKKQIESLHVERTAIDEKNAIRQKAITYRNRMEYQIENLGEQIKRQAQVVQSIKDEQVKEECSTCGQPLDEESIKKVKENRQNRYNKEVATGKELMQKVNDLKKSLSELPEPVEINRKQLNELEDELMDLQVKLNNSDRLKALEEDHKKAVEHKESLRKEKNHSQGIVEAIKEFRTKRSEMMVEKVDGLFTTISVKLYETLKNGEERATFEIEMDGKPYSKLSTAEKIKAGLELIEVLSQQSEVIAPTFVDNAESILNFTAPAGQVVVARVADEDFNIKNSLIGRLES
jgi:chromosome segregation ATPase